MSTADYGARARVGVATPQANPTVEPEMRLLLPAAIGVYGTRLVHPAADVETRLDHYIRHLPEAIGSFGSMRLAAFGFGCTGSSYRAGPTLEDELTSAAANLRGIPVITAAQAIRRALRSFGARRIALVSPYPSGLAESGYSYWKADGLTLVETLRVDPVLTDTHRIYELTSDDAYAALVGLTRHDVDAIVVSGTGMPTLQALRRWRSERGDSPPVPIARPCCRQIFVSLGRCCSMQPRNSPRRTPPYSSPLDHTHRVTAHTDRSADPRLSPRSPTMSAIDRRTALQLGFALAAAPATLWSAKADELLRRRIPSSGESLPVLGLGTNNYSPRTAEERAARRAVLERFSQLGATVIDTAPAYRESEATLGELLAELGTRDRSFVATKVTSRSGTREEGVAMLEASRQKLRTDVLDLVQVHNLMGTAVLLPLLREQVAAKRIRYLGITTSSDEQYPAMAEVMRTERLDFIQIDYSLGNRSAADALLPLAADRGMATLINLPFGGRREGGLFAQVRNEPLPGWAKEIGARSWGQVFLKYVLSHPAVTCVIPGMTQVTNLEDNAAAARGALPDAALRRRMERDWDQIVSRSA